MAEDEKTICVSVEVKEVPILRRVPPHETSPTSSLSDLVGKVLRFRKRGGNFQETVTALRAALHEAGFQLEDEEVVKEGAYGKN